jgi:hypothetical protein
MTYEEIVKYCESLSYRDKFRLAQLLIQLGRKEEEEEYPEQRITEKSPTEEHIQYVADRILKLKPSKKSSVLNSIAAMFQFQGGISDVDKENIINELQRKKVISISETGRVSYPEQ